MSYRAYLHQKTLPDGTKTRHWWYFFYDQWGNKVKRPCPGCSTKQEAEAFAQSISPPGFKPKKETEILGEIAETMYLPGSDHLNRRSQLGKSTVKETMAESRSYINQIMLQWGKANIKSLTSSDIMSFLFNSNKSGRWKNRFIEVLHEIYLETPWYGCRSRMPALQKFRNNSKKADIFTQEELCLLMKPSSFPSRQFYLFFLLCLSGGLRIGEVRAVRAKQFVFDKKLVIIDGFLKQDGRRTTYNKKGTPEHPRLRLVLLPQSTLDQIRLWILQNNIGPEDYCFTHEGKPIRVEYAENVFYGALLKTGFIQQPAQRPRAKKGEGRQKQIKAKMPTVDGRRLIPHSLRYTYISLMCRHVAPHDLLLMTGHTSETMINYYNRKVLDMSLLLLNPSLYDATEKLFLPDATAAQDPETPQPEFYWEAK